MMVIVPDWASLSRPNMKLWSRRSGKLADE